MKLGVSSEQESPKNRTGGLVAGHQSLICGELHHHSGLQGKRFVRFRIGFDYTCCKEGCENNLEKLQKAGFPHMQTQGGTCLPSGTSPHADADAGSFREFRRERSGILEPITLVSPARQRQSGRDEQPFFVGDITGVGSTHGKSVTRGSPVVPPVVLRRAGWSMPKPCFRNPQTRNPAH